MGDYPVINFNTVVEQLISVQELVRYQQLSVGPELSLGNMGRCFCFRGGTGNYHQEQGKQDRISHLNKGRLI